MPATPFWMSFSDSFGSSDRVLGDLTKHRETAILQAVSLPVRFRTSPEALTKFEDPRSFCCLALLSPPAKAPVDLLVSHFLGARCGQKLSTC